MEPLVLLALSMVINAIFCLKWGGILTNHGIFCRILAPHTSISNTLIYPQIPISNTLNYLENALFYSIILLFTALLINFNFQHKKLTKNLSKYSPLITLIFHSLTLYLSSFQPLLALYINLRIF